MKNSLIAFLIFLSVFSQSRAAEPEYASSLYEKVAELEKALSQISSYGAEGKIEVTYSPEFLAAGPKGMAAAKSFDFQVRAKGDRTKLELMEVSPGGGVLDTDIHFLTSERYSRISNDGEAIISSDLTGPDASNMNDFFGPLTAFAFLLPPKSVDGLRPVSPSDLGNAETWKPIFDPLKSHIQIDDRGDILLSYVQEECRWEVLFKKQDGAPLLPYELRSFVKIDGVEILSRELKVDRYREDKNFPFCPEKITLSCYLAHLGSQPVKSSFLAATFTYSVGSFDLNPEIDDDSLEFDPASANKIWDADKRISITVPR